MRRHRIPRESPEEAHSPLDGRVSIGNGSIVVSPKWSFEKGTESNSFLSDSAGKESSRSAGDIGDMGLIPGSERSPGGGNANSLQYSCLENFVDRGAWWTTVHGVAKSQTWLNHWACACTHTYTHTRAKQIDKQGTFFFWLKSTLFLELLLVKGGQRELWCVLVEDLKGTNRRL